MWTGRKAFQPFNVFAAPTPQPIHSRILAHSGIRLSVVNPHHGRHAASFSPGRAVGN